VPVADVRTPDTATEPIQAASWPCASLFQLVTVLQTIWQPAGQLFSPVRLTRPVSNGLGRMASIRMLADPSLVRHKPSVGASIETMERFPDVRLVADM